MNLDFSSLANAIGQLDKSRKRLQTLKKLTPTPSRT